MTRLEMLRRAKGHTLQSLARETGVSFNAIRKLEKGIVLELRLPICLALERYFGCSVVRLMEEISIESLLPADSEPRYACRGSR